MKTVNEIEKNNHNRIRPRENHCDALRKKHFSMRFVRSGNRISDAYGSVGTRKNYADARLGNRAEKSTFLPTEYRTDSCLSEFNL